MLRDNSIHQTIYMNDLKFPIKMFPIASIIKHKIVKSHWHEQIEMLYFIDGNASVMCDSNHFIAKPRDLIIINSSEIHSVENICNRLYYFVFIIDVSLFENNIVTNYKTKTAKNHLVFNTLNLANSTMEQCVQNIIIELENNHKFKFALKSHAFNFLNLVTDHYLKEIIDSEEFNDRISQKQPFYDVLKYIENNFTDDITLSTLCKITKLSESHFCRLFKQITGKKPIQYINMLRIEKAGLLLLNSNFNITEIALQCGFYDTNYFSRVFKKYKGLSPTRYKKTNI